MSEQKLISGALGGLHIAILLWTVSLLSAVVIGYILGNPSPTTMLFIAGILLICSLGMAALATAVQLLTTATDDATSRTLLQKLGRLSLPVLSIYLGLLVLQQLIFFNALAY